MTNNLIIITGQTATGKTKLALEYALKFNGELINCDSRQIYKHLDIITGKDLVNKRFQRVTKIGNFDIGYYRLGDRTSEVEESPNGRGKTSGVKTRVWLYDIVNPKRYFSSFDYQQCALCIIKNILSEGKTPIIIGGTYFYLYHLLYDIETENIPPNWILRKKLEKESIPELQKTLQSFNSTIFRKLNQSEKNNPQRIIRKIEIAIHRRDVPSGRLYKSNKVETLNEASLAKKLGIPNLQIDFIGLKFKKKEHLRSAIEKRVEERLKQGAVKEVRQLLKMGYNEKDPGLKTIGYQQLIRHLRGVLSTKEAIKQWIAKEVQYAKRQYTFMKQDKNIKWKEVETSRRDVSTNHAF